VPLRRGELPRQHNGAGQEAEKKENSAVIVFTRFGVPLFARHSNHTIGVQA
jgi:hypothetical protein